MVSNKNTIEIWLMDEAYQAYRCDLAYSSADTTVAEILQQLKSNHGVQIQEYGISSFGSAITLQQKISELQRLELCLALKIDPLQARRNRVLKQK